MRVAIVRSDLGWSSNTDYIVKRDLTYMEDLKDVYVKQIRSILEFAVHYMALLPYYNIDHTHQP